MQTLITTLCALCTLNVWGHRALIWSIFTQTWCAFALYLKTYSSHFHQCQAFKVISSCHKPFTVISDNLVVHVLGPGAVYLCCCAVIGHSLALVAAFQLFLKLRFISSNRLLSALIPPLIFLSCCLFPRSSRPSGLFIFISWFIG